MWCSLWCSGYIQSSRVQTFNSYTRSLPWTPTSSLVQALALQTLRKLSRGFPLKRPAMKSCWSLRDGKGPFSFAAQTISPCLREGVLRRLFLKKNLCWDTIYPFLLKDKYTLHHSQSGPLPFPTSNVPFRTSPTLGLFFNPMHPLFFLFLLNMLLWIFIHLNLQGIWYFGNGLIHLALAFSSHSIL